MIARQVVGIDPSLTATGVAHYTGALMTIRTKAKEKDGRLVQIGDVIDQLQTDLVVMEDLPRNAMAAGVTGMVQGVIRERLQRRDIPYILVTPATLKAFATGKGNAKKPDMRAAWHDYAGVDNKDDNQVDAAWLREAGLYLTGRPERAAWFTPRQIEFVEKLRPQAEAIAALN